jgi:hypothetical protein
MTKLNTSILILLSIIVTLIIYRSMYYLPFSNIYSEQSVIIDNETNLMWQSTRSDLFSWNEAIEYCENLEFNGYGDWRLPSDIELMSIFKIKNRFPNSIKDFFYWSSTVYEDASHYAWFIDFDYGSKNKFKKHQKYFFSICVRNNSVF